MDGIQNPKDVSGIKDDIGSFEYVGNPFWDESTNFTTLATRVMISAEGMKAAKGAEAMDIELSYNSTKNRLENQSGSMYGNNKRKQPAISLLWLEKKTSHDAYIVHKHDFKDAAVKDRHCRMGRMFTVLNEFYPSQNWDRFHIVGITDLPYSLR